MTQLHHGGRLRQAAAQHHIPLGQWLDLSTGVAPWHYPAPAIKPQYWNRLPEQHDGLEQAAKEYYGGAFEPLVVAGSQAAIQMLPQLLDGKVVALPLVGYKEHQKAWQQAGWQLRFYQGSPSDELLAEVDVLVLINPNNPNGHLHPRQRVQQWHQQLAQRGATLVVDEAFMDLWPQQSITNFSGQAGLVVLRSLGKFFGLAGARVGFVFAWPQLLAALNNQLGPWCVAGPSRIVAKAALQDEPWQQQQAERIEAMALAVMNVLKPLAGEQVARGLFITVKHPNAQQWHHALATQGVLVRLTDEQDGLRFGLPADEAQLLRLQQALTTLR
ncbi:threonine-phosphate decarboxylase CobD [Ferrimonas senticii]|uniref:threonine-phosphate decarboxylase CobD n=1 Tax=Ferrimonas senticii TaxID=394566 RepID=UPI0003F50D67|nr:threonine-phosphate decarboxylase CobD [Ferrimonas senticii]